MKNTDLTIKLRNITKSDYKFLFNLLKERGPIVNILHKKMPTYEEHLKFVSSKPYSKWYIIYYKNQKAGSVYLTKQNEIGIFIKKNMQGKKIGETALHMLIRDNPRSKYFANVNPKNYRSIKFFKRNGFKLIKYTFELN